MKKHFSEGGFVTVFQGKGIGGIGGVIVTLQEIEDAGDQEQLFPAGVLMGQ